MRKSLSLIILPTLFSAGLFFLFCPVALSANTDIVINEIGAFEATGYEWIEIYNRGDEAVDITDWKFYENDTNHGLSAYQGDMIIEPKEYAIIAENAENFLNQHLEFSGTIIDSSWGTLKESGEYIELRTSSDPLSKIEGFVYIGASDYSLERKNPNDMDYSSTNWQEHTDGHTAGEQNSNYYFVQTQSENIKINEFVADPASGENEWVELYNAGENDQDLAGWVLQEGAGAQTALSGVIVAGGFFVVEPISGNLNNGGDIIILKDDQNDIIDQVVYGNWDDGNISDNAPSDNKSGSVARNIDGLDTDNDSDDFSFTETLTKNSANNISVEVVKDEPKAPLRTGVPPPVSYDVGSVIISELVSDPKDDENEWIELRNVSDSTINLNGWTIEDGSGAVDKLSGYLFADSFYIIDNPKGKLNNAGDVVILKDATEIIIDEVAYGNWQDELLADMPPAPKKDYSLAIDSDNKYKLTSKITKGEINIIEQPITSNNSDALKHSITINEILPNPKEYDDEFIEIKNNTNYSVDLLGWSLCNSDDFCFYFIEGDYHIDGNGYLVFFRDKTNLAIKNGGDKITLYDNNGNKVDEIEYKKRAPLGNAYIYYNKLYFWTNKPTPTSENTLIQDNRPPIAVIDINETSIKPNQEVVFDASDSIDPDGDDLTFFWQFGDGGFDSQMTVNYSYDQPGEYEIILFVEDSVNKSSEKINISVLDNHTSLPDNTIRLSKKDNDIYLVEAMPAPNSEQEEYIKIFNGGNKTVDLSGWSIDDEEGGSKPYALKGELKIGDFMTIYQSESKIALNNNGDSIRLFDNNRQVDQVDYANAVKGEYYYLDFNYGWRWSDEALPTQENDSSEPMALERIKELPVGEKVTVAGYVSVEPGALGSQIFYLYGSGIQVYSYGKDFPELAVGDYVQVSGELSEAGGEKRLKISQASDISSISNGHINEIVPHVVKLSEIGEKWEGSLVKVEGTIVEIRGSSIYIDDGSDEAKIYIKASTGISGTDYDLTPSKNITVIGIVGQTKAGYRIMPRYESDIIVGRVAGEQDQQINKSINQKINDSGLNKYLIAISIFFFALAIYFIIQNRRLKSTGWRIVDEK